MSKQGKQAEPILELVIASLEVVISRLPEDKQMFLSDSVLQDATLMRLQEAGEHMTQIRYGCPAYYEQHHSEAWHKLIGLRNIIAHGYLQVDIGQVWDIATKDIPELAQELRQVLGKE